MLPAPPKEPSNIAELFAFYHDYVKVLYSAVQTENALPQEVLFELNAAFDHLSRHWTYGELEDKVVRKCYGHLKRSCLDIFKISVREARKKFDELRKLDTSDIDNGEYDRKLLALFAEIRSGATAARKLEGNGNADPDGPIKAFDAWQPVYANCLRLETEFYHHAALDWSKRRWVKKYWKSTLITVALTFFASYIGREFGSEIFRWFKQLLA
ncbi:hypothetical protein ICHIJ1_03800 [Fluviibacter phosphoraccumulans]|uniref:Uncharacterized protein n=2 Tax=Fluviibacter phosphoraccumulans TaxID=1751046 RepID=A0A679IBB0_9RHOO|nr:hypothetical protein ICHIAU1_02830 [Fluviibacter phosphoraccumulans]BBU70461.1 hypothetical protein ICHIJ1_03800 [Fluviibacter phosphoraccumulans]BCA66189.1 hypothetical protein SHINM1_017910 [Fluviibacter phosphoraccumulans]